MTTAAVGTVTAMPTFSYEVMPIRDLVVEVDKNQVTAQNKPRVNGIRIKDELFHPTDRFWTSLFARYGFNNAFFTYFTHQEVFDRISKNQADDRMRMCIATHTGGRRELLAVSNTNKPVVEATMLNQLVEKYGGESIEYRNGMIVSNHKPRVNTGQFTIGGDAFERRFALNVPVDGYGKPVIYLMMMRMVCANGVVGMAPAFASELAIGKEADNVEPTLVRALDSFNNDEGYAALRQRVEKSTESYASVWETQQLYKQLIGLHARGAVADPTKAQLLRATGVTQYLQNANDSRLSVPMGEDEQIQGMPMFQAFHAMTKNPASYYGIPNLEALTPKKQRALPTQCTVYDLLNFATEVGTHLCNPYGRQRVAGYVGTLLANEYDLESSKDQYGDFADFHLQQRLASGVTGSAPHVLEN